MEETSLGCVESINAHSLQTSQSHVPVAWMVSPADSENNLIIIVLSGSSETRAELFGSQETPTQSPAFTQKLLALIQDYLGHAHSLPRYKQPVNLLNT